MQVVALCHAYQWGHHCAISFRARRGCSALLLGGVVTRGLIPAGTCLGNVVTWSRRKTHRIWCWCVHLGGLHGHGTLLLLCCGSGRRRGVNASPRAAGAGVVSSTHLRELLVEVRSELLLEPR